MTDFVENSSESEILKAEPIDISNPINVIYCPICTMPPEFCEYGASFDKCFPWINENFPEVLSPETIAKMLEKMNIDDSDAKDEKKKKNKGAAPLKKAAEVETKILIKRVQRQKRKFITEVLGIDTIPNLKLKDAAKAFGKKFSSGSSINEVQGKKVIVIQGDIGDSLASYIVSEFKAPPKSIYFVNGDNLVPYEG